MTDDADAATREPRAVPTAAARLHLAFLAGFALATAGMAMTIAGVLLGPLFMPGVYVIGMGLLVLALAGIGTTLAKPTEPRETGPRRGAPVKHT
jgi:hypothetical protein